MRPIPVVLAGSLAAVLTVGQTNAGPPPRASIPPPPPPPDSAPARGPAALAAPESETASFQVPATGYSPATACNDYDLRVMMVAPATRRAANLRNLDRRMSDVLAEERRLAAQASLPQRLGRSLAATLLLVGVALVIAGTLRRRGGLVFGGVLGMALAGGLAMRLAQDELALRLRLWEVLSCRLELLERHAQLEHGDHATCLHDLGEADEALLLLGAQIRSGQPVRLAQIEHLRSELMPSPR